MGRIVITDATFTSFDAERQVATELGLNIEMPDTAKPLSERCVGAKVLMVQFAEITKEIIVELAPKSLIVRYGIGLDNIDLATASAAGVRVVYVPDYATGEVADHATAMGLALLRKLVALDATVRDGKWEPLAAARPMPSFSESTLGLLGFGRIAREVARRYASFEFNVIVHDPHVADEVFATENVTPVGMESLFQQSDCLSLHAPLLEDTHHVVNARTLGMMKPNAVVINTSRGGLIDPDALADALRARSIAAAGIDVFEVEPLPEDSKLRGAPNLLMTPHMAWYSDAATVRVQQLAADEVRRFAAGTPARCPAPE